MSLCPPLQLIANLLEKVASSSSSSSVTVADLSLFARICDHHKIALNNNNNDMPFIFLSTSQLLAIGEITSSSQIRKTGPPPSFHPFEIS